jgi:hypothetical protein
LESATSKQRHKDLKSFYRTLLKFPAYWPPEAKKASRSKGATARAHMFLREQLADGPRPGTQIEAAAQAAEIPARSLISAAPALGDVCSRVPLRRGFARIPL